MKEESAREDAAIKEASHLDLDSCNACVPVARQTSFFGQDYPPSAFAMMAADEYYTFTGGVVPRHVTRVLIDKSITVIPARAFSRHRNIIEVICHDGVVRVGEEAFSGCISLRRVIMPGVKVIERNAFWNCDALTNVECGKLEIIGDSAFTYCKSLRSINLPSAKIVGRDAFWWCYALTNINFCKELESIRAGAFYGCTSLERINIPLKDGMINDDNVFMGCGNLKHVDLVEGAVLRETIAALQMEEWKKVMRSKIDAIKHIVPNTPAGNMYGDVGGKAVAIRMWIESVLHKIIHYKAEHHRYLKEAATILELALWKKSLSEMNVPEGDEDGRAKCRVKCGADVVMKNVLPFLELPPYTFGGED
eukprot:scaffold21639_cov77-Skeletonema_dohrnii-CCMP3373.AAC.3